MRRTEAWTEDRGVRPEDVPLGEIRLITCPQCRMTFTWESERDYQWPPVYCSKRCKRRGMYKRRVRLDGDEVPAIEGMRLLICERCSLPFGWVPRDDPSSTVTPPQYHSQACKRSAQKARNRPPVVPDRTVERQAKQERTEHISAASLAARELLLPASHCVTCNKVAALTKEAAKEAKRAIEERTARTNEVRYYQCPEGFWHWTRMYVWGDR